MRKFIQGVSYYPEYIIDGQFSLGAEGIPSQVSLEDHIRRDFQRMVKAGITSLRMGEFSWSLVEPSENEYHPDLFLKVLDEAHSFGLSVIFCTPTACPPKWIIDKHPEILPVDKSRTTFHFGSRRHYDPLNKVYQEHCRRIVRAYGKMFGLHPSVKCWQIDNEFGHHGTSSLYTEAAQDAFRQWLQEQYKNNLTRLNAEWFTSFWSQRYTSFDQIEPPLYTLADNNPHLELQFRKFCTEVYRNFQKMQGDILREESPGRQITHNLNSSKYAYDLCPWRMTEDLDVVGFDHYQESDFPNPTRSLSNFTLMRSLKGAPFIILEQQPVQVNWQPLNRRLSYDWFPLWALLGAATGCQGIFYFSWQRFLGGAESFHDGILGHDVRVACTKQEKKVQEVSTVIQTFEHLRNGLTASVPPKDLLVLVNTQSHWMHTICSQSTAYRPEEELDRWCSLAASLGLGIHCAESLPTLKELSTYSTLILGGYSMEFTEEESRTMYQYIEGGGKVLSTPRSCTRTSWGGMSQFPLSFLGKNDFHLVDFGALGPEEHPQVQYSDNRTFTGELWIEDIDCVSSRYEVGGMLKDSYYEGKGGVFFFRAPSGGLHCHLPVIPKIESAFQDWYLEIIGAASWCRVPPESTIHILPFDNDKVLIMNYGEYPQPVAFNEGINGQVLSLMEKGVVFSFKEGGQERTTDAFNQSFSVSERSAVIAIKVSS